MLALNISDEIKGCQEKHDIMFNLDREPLFSGQPMMLEDLHHDEHERLDIENLSILSIEQVRDSMTYVERLRVAGLDPGRIEWFGVIDNQLMLYSWTCGESDIEWYYGVDEGFSSRKPLIEA